MSQIIPPDAKLWAELFIDKDGEAHFVCHTKGEDFMETEDAFEKFIEVLRGQILRKKECPFFSAQKEVA